MKITLRGYVGKIEAVAEVKARLRPGCAGKLTFNAGVVSGGAGDVWYMFEVDGPEECRDGISFDFARYCDICERYIRVPMIAPNTVIPPEHYGDLRDLLFIAATSVGINYHPHSLRAFGDDSLMKIISVTRREITIAVPRKNVGRWIGKGGRNIKALSWAIGRRVKIIPMDK